MRSIVSAVAAIIVAASAAAVVASESDYYNEFDDVAYRFGGAEEDYVGGSGSRRQHGKGRSTDYDLLIFAQSWPTTNCIEWKDRSKGNTCNLRKMILSYNLETAVGLTAE